MCFYCILKRLFCIGEGTKTWGHGRQQAILSGQFLGYMCWLVFNENRNRLTCWFFRISFAGLWVYFWNIQTPRPTVCHSTFYRAANMMNFVLYSMKGKSRGMAPEEFLCHCAQCLRSFDRTGNGVNGDILRTRENAKEM